jgi:hypothetical protein
LNPSLKAFEFAKKKIHKIRNTWFRNLKIQAQTHYLRILKNKEKESRPFIHGSLQKEELANTHINIGWYQDWYPRPNQVVMTRGNNTLILDQILNLYKPAW